MKNFCSSLRELTKIIIDFEKKNNVTVNERRIKITSRCKICYICGKRILKKLSKSINYRKFRDHWNYIGKYRATAHSICNLKFNVPIEIAVVFHNGSNYNYHVIIKELSNPFEGKLECIGEKN